jgi:hypothetical protein
MTDQTPGRADAEPAASSRMRSKRWVKLAASVTAGAACAGIGFGATSAVRADRRIPGSGYVLPIDAALAIASQIAG